MEGRVSGNRTFGRGWSRQDCSEDVLWGRPAVGRAGWTASVPSCPGPLADWPVRTEVAFCKDAPNILRSLKMPVEAASCSVCFRAEVFKVSSKITHLGRSGSRRGPAGGMVRLITG